MIRSARYPAAHSNVRGVGVVCGGDGMVGGDDGPARRVVRPGQGVVRNEPAPVVLRAPPRPRHGPGPAPCRLGPLPRVCLRRMIELRFPTSSRVQFTDPATVERASTQKPPPSGNSIFVTLLIVPWILPPFRAVAARPSADWSRTPASRMHSKQLGGYCRKPKSPPAAASPYSSLRDRCRHSAGSHLDRG